MNSVDFILTEDRKILGWILHLNIPFEVKQGATNQIKYSFSRVIDDEIEYFSFSTISNNGMVNSMFDFDCIEEIKKWYKGEETSNIFKLYL